MTGGSPISTGVFYDASYDRALSPPGSNCTTLGTPVTYDSSIDINPKGIYGGGGINRAALPLNPRDNCQPVYPHSYLRVNTIFEVIKASGKRTAWADKHPAYEILNGPSGHGVDDLYTPEIDANNSLATSSVPLAEANDDLKVLAVLNEIDGKNHGATKTVGVPAIFGMNFQAVSVGEKLAGDGYVNGSGQPSAGLLDAMLHTDHSIGRMVSELKARGLFSDTLIIITAKHGQSPIDRAKVMHIDPALVAAAVNNVQSGLLANLTADDVALIWLTDPTKAPQVAQALRNDQASLGIQEVLAGSSLRLLFNSPVGDPRTPDVIAIVNQGVIYTTGSKVAEHGGFSMDDTHVALLVAGAGVTPSTIKSPVETMQIAPTILQALGLDPQSLQAVQKEKTAVLPGF